MRRSTILLSTTAVLVLSAGLVVGRLSTHFTPASPPPDHRNWFQDQLGLSPDQKKSMDGIWADVNQQVEKLDETRRGLDRDRDTNIRAMLSAEELTKYDQILTDSRSKHQELDKKRKDLFSAANKNSRDLLTHDQQAKWDAMQKDMHEHDHDHRGPGPGHPHGGASSQQSPATQPAM